MLISCVVDRYSMTRSLMILQFRCLFSCWKRECSGVFCMSEVSTILCFSLSACHSELGVQYSGSMIVVLSDVTHCFD